MTYLDLKNQITNFVETSETGQTIVGKGCTESQICRTENALGVQIIGSYREFLRDYGWAEFYCENIFGLGDDIAIGHDLVDTTNWERTEALLKLPKNLIPFNNDGMGNLYCINTEEIVNDEPIVVIWDHELCQQQIPAFCSSSFAEWLSETLTQINRE